jgi:hypothetical protein
VWGVSASSLGAVILLGRFGVDGRLTRDQSVYAYAGQQLFHGVAPYDSIFDPKGPLAAMIAAVGAAIGAGTGHAELTGIRLVFGAIACVGVGATFLLSRELWGSTSAGLAAAAGACAMPALAADAFSGPDAKTPAVFLVTMAMWLSLRSRWGLAAAVAALATLTWQPLIIFPAVVILCAAVGVRQQEPAHRVQATRAALFGFLTVMGACLAFFIATGTVAAAFDATVRFPLEGIRHGQTSTGARIDALVRAVFSDSHARGVLWCVGVAALVWLVPRVVITRCAATSDRLRDPLTLVVLLPCLALFGYSLFDFQGAPDLLPLLPFACIGIGGVASLAVSATGRLRGMSFAPAALVLVLVTAAWVLPTGTKAGLDCERLEAMALDRSTPATSTMWAFGDPSPLVLSERRNPDRFVYLASGVAAWKVLRTSQGLSGWMQQIREVDPAVVVFGGYTEGDIYRSLLAMFRADGYTAVHAGQWQVFTRPGTRLRSPPSASGCR